VDLAVGEAPLGAVLVVDRRVDVGVRPDVAHGQEHALRPADIEQKVMDERNAWRRAGFLAGQHARAV
jgi:hypothetical protein